MLIGIVFKTVDLSNGNNNVLSLSLVLVPSFSILCTLFRHLRVVHFQLTNLAHEQCKLPPKITLPYAISVVLCLFRLTAIQQQDLYDLMVNDKEIAEQQNYGDSILRCYAIFLFIYLTDIV